MKLNLAFGSKFVVRPKKGQTLQCQRADTEEMGWTRCHNLKLNRNDAVHNADAM